MDSELLNNIEKGRLVLKKKLADYDRENLRLSSLNTMLTEADAKRLATVRSEIARINRDLEKISKLDFYKEYAEGFDYLAKADVFPPNANSEEVINATKDEIRDNTKIFNELAEQRILSQLSKDLKSVSEIDERISTLKRHAKRVNKQISDANKDGIDTAKLMEAKSQIENQLKLCEDLKKEVKADNISIPALNLDLNNLGRYDFPRDKKLAIAQKYDEKIYAQMSKIIEENKILEIPEVKAAEKRGIYIPPMPPANNTEDPKPTRTNKSQEGSAVEQTEKNPQQVKTYDELEDQDKKTAKKVAWGVVATAGVLATAIALSNCDNDKSKDVDFSTEAEQPSTEVPTTEVPTTEAVTEEPTTEVDRSSDRYMINALINKGYPEQFATYLVNKFSGYIIGEFMDSKYIEGVNADYIYDYIDIKNQYNLTLSEAVDYVNRAYDIQATNFFEDATMNDIIPVLLSLNNRETWSVEDAEQAQSINTAFNRIVDNYLFRGLNEKDITKLDALKHLYKNGTDADKYLEQESEILKDIVKGEIENKENIDAKDRLRSHLEIFATSLNGFTNEEKVLTDNKDFNENAQLKDYFDYYIAWENFGKPIIAMAEPNEAWEIDRYISRDIPDAIEFFATIEDPNVLHKEIVKYGWEKYENTIHTLIKIDRIEGIAETALQGPEFTALCAHLERIKGGNE